MSAKVIAITVLSLIAIVVMLQNRASVSIQLLFWSVPMPRILLIFILLKAFLEGLRALPAILKKRRKIQRNRRISTWQVFNLFKKYGINAKEIAFKE